MAGIDDVDDVAHSGIGHQNGVVYHVHIILAVFPPRGGENELSPVVARHLVAAVEASVILR